MIISGDDKWMYVTNANNNSTSLVDLTAGEEREKIVSSLKADAPFGSTPNSLLSMRMSRYFLLPMQIIITSLCLTSPLLVMQRASGLFL